MLCRERKRKQMADLAARVQELEGENLALVHDLAARDAELAGLRTQLASPFTGAGSVHGAGGAGGGAAATTPEPAVLSGAVLVGMGGQWLRLRPPPGAPGRPSPSLPPPFPAHGLVPLGLGLGYGQGGFPQGAGASLLPAGLPAGLAACQGFPPEMLGAAGLGGLVGQGGPQGLGNQGWGLGQGLHALGQGLQGLQALAYDSPGAHQGWPPPGPGPADGGPEGEDPLQLPAGSLSGGEALGGAEGYDWGGAGAAPPNEGFWGQRLTHRGSGSDPGMTGDAARPPPPPRDSSQGRGRGHGLGRFGRAGSY